MLKKLLLSSIIAFSLLASAFAMTVNINQADIATLAENLKGIGIKKAKAIVDYRKENGNFNSIDDITNVKGIGPKTLAKNRESLSIGESEIESNTANTATAVTEETQSSKSEPALATNKETNNDSKNVVEKKETTAKKDSPESKE
jgi:competence protein ComEA